MSHCHGPPRAPGTKVSKVILGSRALPVLTLAGANRSWTVGARISTDQVVRSLMSSMTWLVKPSFQVSTRPEVE